MAGAAISDRMWELLARWDQLAGEGVSLSAATLCAECPELADAMGPLIEGLREMNSFMGGEGLGRPGRPKPALGPAASTSRFTDLRFHAEGGMGAIYLAYDEVLRREVALKFLQAADACGPTDLRFLREATITARLEHPGVVPIHGMGEDEDGRPCYAMRFIAGRTLRDEIDAFHSGGGPGRDLRGRNRALRELLHRFKSACNTVAFAHSRRIVHCDLKPKNILSGEFDETLVVDWGSALDLDEAADESQPRSGTPGFMSPEYQGRRWAEVGPASDVYSLGATLYQILTGRPPFAECASEALTRTVELGEFSAPRRVNAAVPPALEAVCLKAMATAPGDRYASATDLADDAERWLAGEPVGAHREPWSAHARRWLARHRAMVTAGAIVAAVAMVGLASVVVVQQGANRRISLARDRAEARLDLAIRAIGQFREAVEKNPEVMANVPLRRSLLREPLEFYRRLRDDIRADVESGPMPHSVLARANFELAQTAAEVDSQSDAIRSYQEAIDALETLARDHPREASFRSYLAQCRFNVGLLQLDVGRRDEALANFERARHLHEGLVGEGNATLKARAQLGRTITCIGLAHHQAGRPEQALSYFRQSLVAHEALVRDHPDSRECLAGLADVHEKHGLLYQALARRDEALASYERARPIRERLGLGPDAARDGRYELAVLYYSLGNVCLYARSKDARPNFERALGLLEGLVRENPAVSLYRGLLAKAAGNVGLLLQVHGRNTEAWASFDRVRGLLVGLLEDNPENLDWQCDLALTYHNLGALSEKLGRIAEAEAMFREAIPRQSQALAGRPRSVAYRRNLNTHYLSLGAVLRKLARPDEAAALVPERLKLWTDDAEQTFLAACELAQCAATVESGQDDSPSELQEKGRAYADGAMTLLRRSTDLGLRQIKSLDDPDLDPVRSRPDFRALRIRLQDLAFPYNPFVP